MRATGSAYSSRGLLKARGYRWDPGTAERAKCWYLDVDGGAAVAGEEDFVRALPGGGEAWISHLDATVRFSDRFF